MSELTTRTREYYDRVAPTYSEKFHEPLGHIASALKADLGWVGPKLSENAAHAGRQSIKMFDYACGDGAISKTLRPYVSKILAVDLSDSMVAEYNKAAQAAGYGPEKMTAQQGDLFSDEASQSLSDPEYFNFDLVTVGFGLHHAETPVQAVQRLAERLKKGGVCLILDFASGLRESSSDPSTIAVDGFGREEMKRIFEDADLGGGFDYVIIEEPLIYDIRGTRRDMQFFMARGERI
ncbi:hypothetical protein AJ80_01744 [Polytolypa hystricis UAMH7299]|uniref:Methyltransferase type 12 domain-containing protein n=1 Tax=Polytolypa hystricis (strain UAMH7299) TaxID=1447883 RepID=A0A2B7YZ62_POLH7|nr:hypothetical protein AJ80_01744 [Polytolypa hystricis UAMH7299]